MLPRKVYKFYFGERSNSQSIFKFKNPQISVNSTKVLVRTAACTPKTKPRQVFPLIFSGHVYSKNKTFKSFK